MSKVGLTSMLPRAQTACFEHFSYYTWNVLLNNTGPSNSNSFYISQYEYEKHLSPLFSS
jgi:hypothetical protein